MNDTRFHFRGSRTYLHATSLFNHIMDLYAKDASMPQDIDFLFHKHTDRDCVILKDQQGLDLARIVAQYRDAGNKYFFYETDDLITCHMPYDEDALTRQCLLEGDTITIPSLITNYTFIEKAIAAYKLLLTSLHGEQFGKYVFARIKVNRIPEGTFKITFDRIISKRFFQGTIRQDSGEIGKIFFGVRH